MKWELLRDLAFLSPPNQLERFDEMIEREMYSNRSEAIWGLIENSLVEERRKRAADQIGEPENVRRARRVRETTA